MKRGIVLLLTMCISAIVSGQAGPKSIAEDVPNAKRILAFVEAFNRGDEKKMAEFLQDNISEAALQQHPLGERLAIYRQMHEHMNSIEIREFTDVRMGKLEQAVTALIRTGKGEMMDITFIFEPNPPNKLVALRVQDAGDRSGLGPSRREAAPPMREAEFAAKVLSYVSDSVKQDAFSGVVLIARHGQILVEKAFGDADKVHLIPNDVDTKFNLGSINKLFTRICIDQLVQDGKISFEDRIGKFLPDYPNQEAAGKVTVRELLTMTSGIGDFFGERYQATPKTTLRTLTDYLPLFADKPLQFEPGTQQLYSNGGYIVLGLIIQKAAGQDYYDYVREHVFEAAGMKDTNFYFSEAKVPNRAEGYTHEEAGGEKWRNNEFSRPARGSSAGGGYSTAPDLLKFTKALAQRKLILVSEQNGTPVLHAFEVAGGAPGTNAVLEFDPADENTIIVLSNYDPPAAERVAEQIREWIRSVTI